MLKKLTDWIREQILLIWEAFIGFMQDLFIMWLEHSLQVIVFTFNLLPPPAFLSQQSLGSILGNAGPIVGWFVATFRIGESLALIGAAMTFFIIRRVLTLGIW